MNNSPATDKELARIEARATRFLSLDQNGAASYAEIKEYFRLRDALLDQDVPYLLAEIRRLKHILAHETETSAR